MVGVGSGRQRADERYRNTEKKFHLCKIASVCALVFQPAIYPSELPALQNLDLLS